ncbi:SagB family peptide dehydrogenase [Streptomyces apocyni]|uniref:SagB family peptide dehydrogenase n=1 Tax=Streptomyces apocyni TaxID=2654677 RepID=UPI0012E9D232|nr:SagB family peptide dehydrogenase [Streptomyces apocyni]
MRVRVTRLAVFTSRNGQLVCDVPARHRQFGLRPAAWLLLTHYTRWAEPRDEDAALVKQLLDAGVLIAEGSAEHRQEEEMGPWRSWGTAATYFHLATRTLDGEHFVTAVDDTSRLRQKAEQEPEPDPFKRYGTHSLALPTPMELTPALDRTLRERRTIRRFDDTAPVTLEQLSTALHWTGGVQHRFDIPGFGEAVLKASPSGGSRHPVEIYPVVRNVGGLAPGLYHYAADAHALEALPGAAPDTETLLHWFGDQTFVARAGVLFLYTAMLERSAWKYPTGRTYRAIYADLGHVSQTAYLTGTALGLGVFFTAAMRDEPIEEVFGLDWRTEIPLGINGFGVPHPQEAARLREMAAGGPPGFSYPHDEWDGLG